MEPQEPPQPDTPDEQSLADRVASLESRIEHLENEMKSLAKMEGALTRFLGRGNSGE